MRRRNERALGAFRIKSRTKGKERERTGREILLSTLNHGDIVIMDGARLQTLSEQEVGDIKLLYQHFLLMLTVDQLSADSPRPQSRRELLWMGQESRPSGKRVIPTPICVFVLDSNDLSA